MNNKAPLPNDAFPFLNREHDPLEEIDSQVRNVRFSIEENTKHAELVHKELIEINKKLKNIYKAIQYIPCVILIVGMFFYYK